MSNSGEDKRSKSKSEELSNIARFKRNCYTYYKHAYSYIAKHGPKITFELVKDITLILLALATIRVGCQQNTISERSMKIGNRSYLVMEKMDYQNSFFISNYGKTPSFHTKIYYSGTVDTGEFVPSGVYTDSIITHSTIGTVLDKWIPINDKRAGDEWLSSNSAYCEGEIIYSDVFDNWHGYKFCFHREYGNWTKYKNYNYPFEIKRSHK